MATPVITPSTMTFPFGARFIVALFPRTAKESGKHRQSETCRTRAKVKSRAIGNCAKKREQEAATIAETATAITGIADIHGLN